MGSGSSTTRAAGAQTSAPNWLPQFCGAPTLFAVMVVAELVALVIVFAPGPQVQAWLPRLGVVSVYVQWLALLNAVVLCSLRRPLQRLEVHAGLLAAWVVSVLVTALASAVICQMDQALGLDLSVPTDGSARFVLANAAISALIAAALLRYLFVLEQWRARVHAASKAQVDALQARIRPHFLFNSMNTIASLIRTRPGRGRAHGRGSVRPVPRRARRGRRPRHARRGTRPARALPAHRTPAPGRTPARGLRGQRRPAARLGPAAPAAAAAGRERGLPRHPPCADGGTLSVQVAPRRRRAVHRRRQSAAGRRRAAARNGVALANRARAHRLPFRPARRAARGVRAGRVAGGRCHLPEAHDPMKVLIVDDEPLARERLVAAARRHRAAPRWPARPATAARRSRRCARTGAGRGAARHPHAGDGRARSGAPPGARWTRRRR